MLLWSVSGLATLGSRSLHSPQAAAVHGERVLLQQKLTPDHLYILTPKIKKGWTVFGLILSLKEVKTVLNPKFGSQSTRCWSGVWIKQQVKPKLGEKKKNCNEYNRKHFLDINLLTRDTHSNKNTSSSQQNMSKGLGKCLRKKKVVVFNSATLDHSTPSRR